MHFTDRRARVWHFINLYALAGGWWLVALDANYLDSALGQIAAAKLAPRQLSAYYVRAN